MITDERDELVVALPYLGLVTNALRDAGVGKLIGRVDRSPLLDLALIPLQDPPRIARELQRWNETHKVREMSKYPRPEATDSALDHILWSLRTTFADQHGNWIPTLGKNRVLGRVPGMENPQLSERPADRGVSGAEEVSHGGGGAPTVARGDGWLATRGKRERTGVSVGVLDSALRTHPFLEGAWIGPSPVIDSDPVAPEAGHATFVSGLVLKHAPDATLHAATLLDDHGIADSWAAANEIVRLGRQGVEILNLSFVSYTSDSAAPLVLATAIDRLPPDVVVVAAAGNHGFLPGDGNRKPAWPAALDDVLAVGALDGDRPASFSPDGPWVDVVAPGQDLVSTYLDGSVRVWGAARAKRFGGFAKWSGTSFAAATVSGAIAARTKPGRASARDALDWILETMGGSGAGGGSLHLDPEKLGEPPW
jgi:membrane-anchored mycosin MYCP